MSAHPFCPSCGYNFERDTSVARGAWLIDPAIPLVVHEGRPLRFTRTEVLVLHTLAASDRAVKPAVIANRATENVAVYVCRLRARFREYGVPCPIETVRGSGYQWKGEA